MHSPIAATALLEPIPRKPIPPQAAAWFAARTFCALFRFPTRSVRKLQVVVALATIDSAAGEKPPLERLRLTAPCHCLVHKPNRDGNDHCERSGHKSEINPRQLLALVRHSKIADGCPLSGANSDIEQTSPMTECGPLPDIG